MRALDERIFIQLKGLLEGIIARLKRYRLLA